MANGVSLEKLDCGTRAFRCYGRRDEEFLADFELVARRTLDAGEFGVFRLHFLGGLEYGDCCRILGLKKGDFFHCAYQVMHKVGRACRETRPYAIFPLREYFAR